jgi:small multidrug resistance pump
MISHLHFALLAGVSAATWAICLKVGSTRTNAVLGAMVISGAAFLINAFATFVMKSSGQEIVFRREGFWLLVSAGIAAAGVDIFALLAYSHGLRITSSLIIGGTSTSLVLIVGFLALHEPLTAIRLLGIALIVAGIILLQAQG